MWYKCGIFVANIIYMCEFFKVCSKCNINKPIKDFYPLAHCKYGVSNYCIFCQKIISKEYYLKNKEKAKKRAFDWTVQNKNKRKKITLKYDLANKDKKAIANKKRIQKLKAENIEKFRIINKNSSHQRRAKMKNIKIEASKEDIELIIKLSEGVCVYCNKKRKITIDHFAPIAKNGRHHINNFLPSCKSCNSSKNDKNGYNWLLENNNFEALKRIELFIKKIKTYRLKKKLMKAELNIEIIEV